MFNSWLATPTDEEIKNVLFGIDPNKELGPDGMSGVFYRTYWETLKDDLFKMMRIFIVRILLSKLMNKTNLVLILKVDTPSKLNDYRPISQCNTIYKVISKILLDRIKPTLSSLISLT